MKIGILGGSFDPVHNGHIALAQNILDKFELDKIVFVPANCSPHKKENTPIATAKERIEMLRLATKSNNRFEVSDCEIKRGDVSYSIDTVFEFEKKYPSARLFWIIGEDAFLKLDSWHRAEDLKRKVVFLVARRKIDLGTKLAVNNMSFYDLENPLWEVSSSEIREKIKAGKLGGSDLNGKVSKYILDKKLYL